MKALVYKGAGNVAVESAADPKLEDPKDVIIRVTSTAICGSDLHLFGGFIPELPEGQILGHEFMGEVVEAGAQVEKLKIGDRAVIPFPISCGQCGYCQSGRWSLCDTTNSGNEAAEKFFGYPTAGIYGHPKMFGQFRGGQAELVRVAWADANALKVPRELADEKALFLSDILPTGYMAAENADIKQGGTVAIWGAGPVGQFALRCAFWFGASKVIVIDSFPERLALAAKAGAQTINDEETKGLDVFKRLKDLTNGYGPDSVIDAVGMEAHGTGYLPGFMDLMDRAKQTVLPGQDRGNALREAVYACRKGGTVSIIGAYGGFVDNFPMGMAFNKSLKFKMGQTHVHRYLDMLLNKIRAGDIDPAEIITHRLPLADAAKGYDIFRNKKDGCIKVVLKP